MNRNDEYTALLEQLSEAPLPAALEDSVVRAQKRAHCHQRGRRWGTALTSLGGLAAVFTLAVNLSLPFALACGQVPILKGLAAAVAFSPSLRQAVQNDYVQPVGQSQTVDGLTMTVDYIIADRRQVNVFFHFEGDAAQVSGTPKFLSGEGANLPSTSITSGGWVNVGEYGKVTLEFHGEATAPEELRFLYSVTEIGGSQAQESTAPISGEGPSDDAPPLLTFSFDLTLDQEMISQGKTYPIDQWVELDGQQVHIVEAQVFPTFLEVKLDYDPANTAYLVGLNFYVEDEKGQRTDAISNGISGTGLSDSPGLGTVRQESPFFWTSKHLTLHITGADWLDKAQRFVTVDLTDSTCDPALPDGLLFGGAVKTESGGAQVLLFGQEPSAEEEDDLISYQIASTVCTGPQGEKVSFDSISSLHSPVAPLGEESVSVPEGYFASLLTMADCPYDTLTLELTATRRDVPLGREAALTLK